MLSIYRNLEFYTHHLSQRFFSNLVEESLVNFQCKVSQIMKAISFTFDDFDFIINPFQLTGMDGIFTMAKNTITMAFKHFHKAV